MTDHDGGALISFDFVRSFPHKTWVSEWSNDESYPHGFRYKLIATRHEDVAEIELIILLQHRNGEKEVLKHLDIAMGSFDQIANTFVEGLPKSTGLISIFMTSANVGRAVRLRVRRSGSDGLRIEPPAAVHNKR